MAVTYYEQKVSQKPEILSQLQMSSQQVNYQFI